MKSIVIIIVLLVAAGGGVYLWQSASAKPAAGAAELTTAKVARGTLVQSVASTGRIAEAPKENADPRHACLVVADRATGERTRDRRNHACRDRAQKHHGRLTTSVAPSAGPIL